MAKEAKKSEVAPPEEATPPVTRKRTVRLNATVALGEGTRPKGTVLGEVELGEGGKVSFSDIVWAEGILPREQQTLELNRQLIELV